MSYRTTKNPSPSLSKTNLLVQCLRYCGIQNEAYFRQPKMNFAARRFSIRCRTLLTKSFSISHRHIKILDSDGKSSVFRAAKRYWKTDGEGETFIFSLFDHYMAALTFIKPIGERIFLFIQSDGIRRSGVNILIPDRDQPVEDM